MRKRVLIVVVGLSGVLTACGGAKSTSTHSGLPHRVLASQSVSGITSASGLFIINGDNDTIPRVAPLENGSAAGLMVVSPTRNIAATVDSSSNTVLAVDTAKESSIGSAKLPAPVSSIAVPTASPTGFAAVPGAVVNGFAFLGAVELLSFSTNSFTTIAVSNAQTIVSNSTGTQLLVFSPDTDAFTVLFPTAAVPPVDTSCYSNPGNSVCTIVQDSRLSRPVNAIISGTTAYILNCGFECGGTLAGGAPAPASVVAFDLGSLTVTQTVPVDGATIGLLNGSTLYVAGAPPNTPCPASQKTTAATCGMLDVVNLTAMQVTGRAAITDGYHDRMDLTTNGQVFIGSHTCTNIGNANNPTGGEVRGCLSIYKTADGSVLFPPDNGDVTGLQGFTTRNVEYVAEGGQLRVYDTTKDILLINDFVPIGTIDIVGYVGDVKAIDFF